jgi:TonB-linked SusC/RagA family outer membrane protein
MKQTMNEQKFRWLRRGMLLLAAGIVSLSLSAQNTATITVRGRVVDAGGEAIIGASVVVVGHAAIGTASDVDGNFTLGVPTGSRLLVSYLGMVAREVAAEAGAPLLVRLEEDQLALDEVVVVGYGYVKRKDLTGAVASVGENVLRNIPLTSTAGAMAGRLPGVSVVTTQGSPDASVQIRVRGGGSISQDNSPLLIVDGFQVGNIDHIPPGDIESIDVLKDAASTAIYGAKGANGVILITTKGGRGGRAAVDFNASVGFNSMYNETPVLSPYEYVYLQRELDLADNAGFFSRYGRWEDIDIYRSMPGNNWQQKLFDRTGVKQNYHLNISGGEGSLMYSVSYTRDDEQYIMQTSNNKRDNLNIKLNKVFNEHLKLEFNPKMTYRVINGASVSDGAKLRDCVKFPSIGTLTSLTLDDLGDGYNLDNLSNLNDPFYNVANEYKKQYKFNNSYQAALTWDIVRGLSLRAEGAYAFQFDRTDQIYLKNTGQANEKAGQPVAYRTYWTGNQGTVRAVANYTANVARHSINAIAGFEMNHSERDRMVVNSDYYPHDYSAENILAMWNNGTSEPTYTTIEEPSRTESFFARADYGFDSRYLLTLTARADGTNVFAPNNKWGVFPAASAAWRLSDESFMEATREWLSNLKFRVSYGLAGNARVGSYWRQTYSPVTNTKNLYYVNEVGQSALQPSNTLRNENLTWETKYSSNLGMDLGVWRDRIGLTVDLYRDITKNLIMQVDLPSNSGYTTQYQNLGQTTNRGLEVGLNGYLVDRKDFYLQMNFNISFNKNRVDALYGTHADQMIVSSGSIPEIGRDNYRIFVGDEVGLMWGYVSDGMYSFDDFTFDDLTKKWKLKDGAVDCSGVLSRSGDYFGPGHMKLKDLNNDNKVDADNDRRIIGRAQPLHTGGFSFNTGWKNLELIAMFNWSYGNDILNVTKLDYNSYAGSKRYQNMSAEMRLENRFTFIDPATGYNIYSGTHADPELLQQLNANAKYWHPMANATVMTDYAVEDGSFLRLGNLTLAYTLPQALTTRAGVKNLRLYATAGNLFCWTAYSGQDPEVNTSSGNLTPGFDYSAYPKSRTCLVGINVTF